MYIGIDIGATYTKYGVIDENNVVMHKGKVQTPNPLQIYDIEYIIANNISKSLNKSQKILSIGIGLPAIVHNKIPQESTNLLIENFHLLSDFLSEKYSCNIIIENDAKCAAYSELKLNNLPDNFIFITLGTGIGGAIVINKKIFKGDLSNSGEFGHLIFSHDKGIYFEKYFNHKAITEYTKNELHNFPNSILNQLNNFEFNEISDVASKGDDLAIVVLNHFGKILGKGLASIVNTIGILNILFGGGVSLSNKYLFEIAEKEMNKHLISFLKGKVKLHFSKFNNDSGFIGAALLGKDSIDHKGSF